MFYRSSRSSTALTAVVLTGMLFTNLLVSHAQKTLPRRANGNIGTVVSTRGSSNLTTGVCETPSIGAVEVEATLGVPGPTGYATLKAAFDAINLGTHLGAITIDVCGDTVEAAAAVLNAGLYSQVLIRPVGGPRIIEGNLLTTGAIVLNGADNVTIDGRIGGSGNSRDLTVRNLNVSPSASAAIWLSSVGTTNGATGNTIRNLELSTGSDSTTSSSSATFGIVMCGPSISVTSNGAGNDNNSFIANRIVKARYGIMTRGTPGDLNVGPIVTDNIIGPTAFGTDQIGKVGIFMQYDTGASVSRNRVQFVGCLASQACPLTDRVGIAIGGDDWSMTPGTLTSNSYSVTRNIVRNVVDEKMRSAVGINLATTGGGLPTNNLLANNFIFNIRANGTSGDQTVGLGIAGGHSDKVVFNSISLTGDVDPGSATVSNNFGSGIRIANASGTSHANLTLQNNSVYLDLSSSNGTVSYYAISGHSSAYSFGTGGENFNNYYLNPANLQLRTGGLGNVLAATLGAEFSTLAAWQGAYTPIAQDANSIQADPLYFSTTSNLHIGLGSPNIGVGTPVAGVTEDYDGAPRPANPDIGADEAFNPTAANVSLSGRVLTASGQGIRNALVTIEGGGLSEPIIVQTGSFGYYYFNDLPAGHTYIVTVRSRRHAFAEPTRLLNLNENVSDADFVANP